MKINPDIKPKHKKVHSAGEYITGLTSGDRFLLSESITLIESAQKEKRILGLSILDECYQKKANTLRIAISGSPGVGKSTFIDYLAQFLIGLDHKVAILAIDPSSQKSKGSILGDKTRMENISSNRNIFIRPTSAKFELGGIAETTKEAIHLCEAAGFDIIIVETVGVGQSEIAASNIVDLFCLLIIPGAGDDLQGLKRGITEMADIVVVNKSDGNLLKSAEITKNHYAQSLHLFRPRIAGYSPQVYTSSSTEKTGIEKIWKGMQSFINLGKETGYFYKNRKNQEILWFSNKFKDLAIEYFLKKEIGLKRLQSYEASILTGKTNPFAAIRQLFEEVFIQSSYGE